MLQTAPNPTTTQEPQETELRARAYLSEFRQWREVQIIDACNRETWAHVTDLRTQEPFFFVPFCNLDAVCLKTTAGEVVQFFGKPKRVYNGA